MSASWPSALNSNPCPTQLQSRQRSPTVPTPTPATLMDIPSVITGQQLKHVEGQKYHKGKYVACLQAGRLQWGKPRQGLIVCTGWWWGGG